MDLDVMRAMREFHQFYNAVASKLVQEVAGDAMSKAEARVFLEIATSGPLFATDIRDKLQLDRSHVSRIILSLEGNELVTREKGENDGRRRVIRLSSKGLEAFNELQQQHTSISNKNHWGLLEQEDLVDALTKARLLLSIFSDQNTSWQFKIRPFRARDIGMIAARQSRAYSINHDNCLTLELFESEMSHAFLRNFDAEREQCLVAEIGVTMVGAVVIINNGGGLACIHHLHVEPFARGHGIGDALLARSIDFARQRHYREIMLTLQAKLGEVDDFCVRNGFRKKKKPAQTVSEDLYMDLSP